MNKLNYQNIEIKTMTGGRKIVRKVSIKNGKGYKSVTKYRKGKKTKTVKKPIHKDHICLIKMENLYLDYFQIVIAKKKNKTN